MYDEDNVVGFHEERYNLVMDPVEQRNHSLVAFNWTHERDYLIRQAEKRKIKYAVIDGSVSAKVRKDVVDRMQVGQLQVVFAHPQSAGHGLTLRPPPALSGVRQHTMPNTINSLTKYIVRVKLNVLK